MASKKLKVELELETAKAKRQAKELESPSARPGPRPADGRPSSNPPLETSAPIPNASWPTPGAASPAESLSASLKKAAKSAEKSSSAFDRMNGTAGRLTKGFAGIAVGMAASYAANYATGGTKTALDYGGNAVTGAVGGAMMAGLPGAIVGGLAGVLKTYMEKDSERSAMSKDFETGEAVYAATRRDNEKFEELSSMKKGADVAGHLAEAQKIIDNYTNSAADFVEAIRKELKKHDPDKEKIEKLKRNLDYSRSQISKYEGLVKSLEAIREKQVDPRTSTEAFDALGKVGGSFVSGFAAPAPDVREKTGAAPDVPSAGGSFAFSVPAAPAKTFELSAAAEGLEDPTERAIKIADELTAQRTADMLDVLKSIDSKIGTGGGGTWQ